MGLGVHHLELSPWPVFLLTLAGLTFPERESSVSQLLQGNGDAVAPFITETCDGGSRAFLLPFPSSWMRGWCWLPRRSSWLRPVHRSPAHHSAEFAELVCGNSLEALSSARAAGC